MKVYNKNMSVALCHSLSGIVYIILKRESNSLDSVRRLLEVLGLFD